MLFEAVKGVEVFDPAQHIESLRAARKKHVKTKEESYQSELDSILMQFASERKRAIKRAISSKNQHGHLSFQSLPATLTCLQLKEMGWQFAICVIQETYIPSVTVVEPH